MVKAINRRYGTKSTFRLNTEAMITAFILAMAVRTFVICPFKIPSESMEPTLHGHPRFGDRILVNRFRYFFREVSRGDIVIFKIRGIKALGGKKDFIKRIVGLPGDSIAIDDGRVYINGKILEEPEIFKDQRYSFLKRVMKFGDPENPVKIPEDSFFVMGDNTENSKDSRFFGFVPRENLAGRAFLIYWPFKRFGWLK